MIDRSASAAIGCPVRKVHYTGHDGYESHEEVEYVIPDWCTMDETYDTDRRNENPRVFQGCSPGYMDHSNLSYCIARDAAIDLAEGMGILVPDRDSDSESDPGDWDGG